MLEQLAAFNDELARRFPKVSFRVLFDRLQIILECRWDAFNDRDTVYVESQAIPRFIRESDMPQVLAMNLSRMLKRLDFHFNPKQLGPEI